jgi:hypothetical protein
MLPSRFGHQPEMKVELIVVKNVEDEILLNVYNFLSHRNVESGVFVRPSQPGLANMRST